MVVPGSMPIIIFSGCNLVLLTRFKGNQLSRSKLWFRLFQVMVITWAIYFLVSELQGKWSEINLHTIDMAWLLIALFLMPVNWLLEAFKWKHLTSEFAPSSLLRALRSVWIGSFYTLFTPNRIGDGAGRLHLMPEGNASRATWAFLNGSVAQTLVTLSAGSTALALAASFVSSEDELWWKAAPLVAVPVWLITVIALLLYLEPGWLRMLKEFFSGESWIGKRLHTLQAYTRRQNAATLMISTLRYATFSCQFIFVLKAFGFAGNEWEVLMRIALIYLATTIIPTIALAELGLRESMAVLFLPAAGIAAGDAFSATLILWGINLLLPSIFGAIFFAQLRQIRSA